jgi:hypothetical protein
VGSRLATGYLEGNSLAKGGETDTVTVLVAELVVVAATLVVDVSGG